jgi:hypothetical protein
MARAGRRSGIPPERVAEVLDVAAQHRGVVMVQVGVVLVAADRVLMAPRMRVRGAGVGVRVRV